MKGFETAIALSGRYLAVAGEENGVRIYSLTGQTLELKLEISIDNFEGVDKLAIQDLAYIQSSQSLLVLDENRGVYSFNLNFGDAVTIVKSEHPIS